MSMQRISPPPIPPAPGFSERNGLALKLKVLNSLCDGGGRYGQTGQTLIARAGGMGGAALWLAVCLLVSYELIDSIAGRPDVSPGARSNRIR